MSRIETDMAQDEIIEAEFEEIAPERPGESRALAAITRPNAQPRASGLPFSFRADASFVAQLIAAAANAPQTRTCGGRQRKMPWRAIAER